MVDATVAVVVEPAAALRLRDAGAAFPLALSLSVSLALALALAAVAGEPAAAIVDAALLSRRPLSARTRGDSAALADGLGGVWGRVACR